MGINQGGGGVVGRHLWKERKRIRNSRDLFGGVQKQEKERKKKIKEKISKYNATT